MTKPGCPWRCLLQSSALHLLTATGSEAGHALHQETSGEQEREVCCGVLVARGTGWYLQAEGWLLVQLTSHAGVSSWLAGALYLSQAEREEKKIPSVTRRNKNQPLLIPN